MPRRGDVWISSSPARRLAVCAGCEHDMDTWCGRTHADWVAAQINATFGVLNV